MQTFFWLQKVHMFGIISLLYITLPPAIQLPTTLKMLCQTFLSNVFLNLFSLESNPDNNPPEGKTNEDIQNNNEPVEAPAHDKAEATAEVDEIAGAANKSLVYADVIQLLETILEKLEE